MQPEQLPYVEAANQTSFLLNTCKVLDSLFKQNKKRTREFIFNSLISMNLKLHSSREVYLNALLELLSGFLDAEWFIILVKVGEYINLLKWDLQSSKVINRTTNDPELLLAFAQLMSGSGQVEANALSHKFAGVLLNEIELEITLPKMKAYSVAKTLQMSEDTSTEIIGLTFCQEPNLDSRATLWSLLSH